MNEDRNKPEARKLRAEDEDDLTVLAAYLQDATVKADDMAYLPRQHRFAAVANRYRWELQETKFFKPSRRERVRCGFHFDGVLSAQFAGFQPGDDQRVLELLTISCNAKEDGAAAITLVFAGGAAVRLEVECIDAHFADISAPWPARRRPDHKFTE